MATPRRNYTAQHHASIEYVFITVEMVLGEVMLPFLCYVVRDKGVVCKYRLPTNLLSHITDYWEQILVDLEMCEEEGENFMEALDFWMKKPYIHIGKATLRPRLDPHSAAKQLLHLRVDKLLQQVEGQE